MLLKWDKEHLLTQVAALCFKLSHLPDEDSTYPLL